ncbi:MAG: ABC transporter permease [Acidobacteria bacterium]|nr:ABC transporter permease [Acidobacteriota bacterium]
MEWKHEVRRAFEIRGNVPDDDVIEELSIHAAAAYESARPEGSSVDEARRHVEAIIESWSRDAALLRRPSSARSAVAPPPISSARLAGFTNDVRYAWRLLLRQPAFALLTILTIALGIGTTTTLFSITYGVLLKPLPWPEPERLIRISESRQGATRRMPNIMTNASYLPWREQPATIEDVGGWFSGTATLTGVGEADRIRTASVTPSLFSVLRARPFFGTLFAPGDELPGRPRVAVLSYGLWLERFGAAATALGQTIQLDGRPYRIVGIMLRDFVFPDRETRVWTPLAVPPVVGPDGKGCSLSMFSAMARLRPGATPAQAAAEATGRARGGPDQGLVAIAVFGSRGPAEITAVPALEAVTAEVRPALLMFMAAVALLLMTATANVAGLQLARATARQREIAIRAAIGACRSRITRQLLVESLLLSAAGGAAGLLVSLGLHALLPSLLPADFPRLDNISVDAYVILFSFCASLLTGVAFGLAPVLHIRRLNLTGSLAVGSAALAFGGWPSIARTRMLIMTGQVAIACVLLVGAVLLTRSFIALINADRGYEPRNLLTARITMNSLPVQERLNILESLVERLKAIPDVQFVGFTDGLPLTGGETSLAFTMQSLRPPVGSEIRVNGVQRVVSDDYFAALGMRLAAGRSFEASDTAASPHVVVVNQSFARKYLDDSAVGDRFRDFLSEGKAQIEVIGVVDDVKQRSVTDPSVPEVYISYRQMVSGQQIPWTTQPSIVVRTAGEPREFIPLLKSKVRERDSSLVPESIMTMEERLSLSLARPRLYAMLFGVFAVFAVVIAAVGLFGVLCYSVGQRSRELAVRAALGARPRDIVRLVVAQGLGVTLAGLVIGLWSSFALVQYLTKFLYGVPDYDAISFLAVSAVVGIVAIAASAAPAWGASRVDPMQVLRSG